MLIFMWNMIHNINNLRDKAMKHLLYIFIFLLLELLIGIVASFSWADQAQEDLPRVITEDDTPKLLLPKPLEDFIQRNKKIFGALSLDIIRVPSKEDTIGKWATYSKENIVPYATWGDFNGDGLKDVALILIRQAGKARRWEFYVFHQLANQNYQAINMDHRFDGQPQQIYLTTLKAGEKIVVEGKSLPYTYEYDSIVFSSFEGEPPIKKIFGWNNKHVIYRKTVLDSVEIKAAFIPVEADLPRVITENGKKKLLLPKIVEMVLETEIRSKYPEVRIPVAEDIMGGWKKYNVNTIADWMQYNKLEYQKVEDSVPYATWGDFNGDGLKDIALILIGNLRGLVVAFNQTDNHSYEVFLLERFPHAGPRYKTQKDFQRGLYCCYLFTLPATVKTPSGMFGFEYNSIALFAFPELAFPKGEMNYGAIFYWSRDYNFYGTNSYGGFLE